MTDKIGKELAKFTSKERSLVAGILQKLKTGDVNGLQVSKLKGHDNIFRVRKGRLRVIYQKQSKSINILAIERRSEKTYKDY